MMLSLVNKLRRKLNNNSGMSVAEMLVAMAIVSLVGSGVFMAISLGSSRYAESMRMSESEELFATLETSLTHELRYTTSAVLANQGEESGHEGLRRVETLFSKTYAVKNKNTALVSIDDDNNPVEFGELAFGNDGKYNRILGTASYPNELTAKACLYYRESDGRFRVEISIKAGNTVYVESRAFEVKPLNGITIE